MLYTTFRLAKESGACVESYHKAARHVGGVRKYGENTPIPLTEVPDLIQTYLFKMYYLIDDPNNPPESFSIYKHGQSTSVKSPICSSAR